MEKNYLTMQELPEVQNLWKQHTMKPFPTYFDLNKPYYIVIWKDYTGKVYRSVYKYGPKISAIFHFSDLGVQIPHMRRIVEQGANYITFKSEPIYVPSSREVLYIFTVRKKLFN